MTLSLKEKMVTVPERLYDYVDEIWDWYDAPLIGTLNIDDNIVVFAAYEIHLEVSNLYKYLYVYPPHEVYEKFVNGDIDFWGMCEAANSEVFLEKLVDGERFEAYSCDVKDLVPNKFFPKPFFLN